MSFYLVKNMDKVRSYFPEKNIPGRSQDELVLNQLMNIIEI